MLAPFQRIQSASLLPLDLIAGVLDWRNDVYEADRTIVSFHAENNPSLVPLFLLDDKFYVSVELGRADRPMYPGMIEKPQELYARLKIVNYTTLPVQTETIDGFVYGLIPWIADAQDVFNYARSHDCSLDDVREMVECGVELSEQGVFHLDVHSRNIVKADRMYFIDPSIATPHPRPKHNYFNERALQHHWAPEVMHGGDVSEKSSVFSLGKMLLDVSLDKRLKDMFVPCVKNNPANRPSFKELFGYLQQI